MQSKRCDDVLTARRHTRAGRAPSLKSPALRGEMCLAGEGRRGSYHWGASQHLSLPVFSSSMPVSFCLGRRKKNVKTNLRERNIKMPPSPPVIHLPRNTVAQFPSPKRPPGNQSVVAFSPGCLLSARLLLPCLTGPPSVRLPLLPWRAASGGNELGRALG